MKICIPILQQNGFDSPISSHFGQASSFAMVERRPHHHVSTKHWPSSWWDPHACGTDSSVRGECRTLRWLGCESVHLFEQQGIHVYNQASGTVAEALKAYKAGTLPEATDATACQEHAH